MKNKTTIKLIASAWRKRIWGFYDLQNTFAGHQRVRIPCEEEVEIFDTEGRVEAIITLKSGEVKLPIADIPTLFKLNPRILK